MTNKSVKLTAYCIWKFRSAIINDPKFFSERCVKALREASQIDGCYSDCDFISKNAYSASKKDLVIDHSYPWNLVFKGIIVPMIVEKCSYNDLVSAIEKYLKRIIVTKEEHKKLTAYDQGIKSIDPNTTPETRLKEVLGKDGYCVNNSNNFPKEHKRNTLELYLKEYGTIK